MKKLILLAIISALGGGCASLRTDDALATISAAAQAAGGDYGKALQAIYAAAAKKQAATDPLQGYQFSRTYYFDGAPVSDPARITWTDRWEKTDSAGTSTPPVPQQATTGNAADGDKELVAEIAEILTNLGLAE